MKNIVLLRTSTVKQEVESQKKEILEYAESFGAENIVIIGGVGASAIKLDDQYLFNIQQVYKLIDEERRKVCIDNIQAVIAMKIDKWQSSITLEALSTSVVVIYDRKSKCFTYTDKDEPQWQSIRIIRQIKGRVREYKTI